MEDYAAAIATIRDLHIIMRTKDGYYLLDRVGQLTKLLNKSPVLKCDSAGKGGVLLLCFELSTLLIMAFTASVFKPSLAATFSGLRPLSYTK